MIRLRYDKDSDIEGIEIIRKGDFIEIHSIYYWNKVACSITLSEKEVRKFIQELQELLPKNEPAIAIDTVTGILKYHEYTPGTIKAVKSVDLTNSTEDSVDVLQALLVIAKEILQKGGK